MRPKGMEDLAAFSAREVKRKRRVFLCRRTVGVKVGSKVIPVSVLKVEGREMLVGTKDRRGTERRIGRWSEPRS